MRKLLCQMRSVLKASNNQIRGIAMACLGFETGSSCLDSECKICHMMYLVRSYPTIATSNDHFHNYEREYFYIVIIFNQKLF